MNQKLLNTWPCLHYHEGRKSFRILNCLHNATESKTPKVLATSLEGTYTHTSESTMGLEEADGIHCTTYRTEKLYFRTQHDFFLLSFPSFLSFWLVLNNSFVYHITQVKVRFASTQRMS